MSTIRAAIYARLSDADEGTSLPNQLAQLREEARRKGWQVVAEIQDVKSGGTFQRIGWRKMERLIGQKAIDVILATELARISRDDLEYPLLQRDVLKPAGVRIFTLMEGWAGQDDPDRVLSERMGMVINAHYRRVTSWKITRWRRGMAEKGLWASSVPFGTMAGPVKGIPVKDPAVWPAVQLCFELAAAGHTTRHICAELAKRGLSGKRGGEMGHSSVHKLLSTRFYLGEIWLNGDCFEAQHDCRIDPALWEAAQHSLTAPKRAGPATEHIYLLSRVFTDLVTITAPAKRAGEPLPLLPKFCQGRGGRKYYYYYRADKVKAWGGIKAEGSEFPITIPAGDLEQAVMEWLIRNLKGARHSRVLGEHAEATAAALKHQAGAIRGKLLRAERDIQKAQAALGEAYIANREVAEAVLAVKQRLEKDKASLQAELAECEHRLANLKQVSEDQRQKVHVLELLWKEGRRAELKRALDTIVLSVCVRPTELLIETSIPVGRVSKCVQSLREVDRLRYRLPWRIRGAA